MGNFLKKALFVAAAAGVLGILGWISPEDPAAPFAANPMKASRQQFDRIDTGKAYVNQYSGSFR